MDAAHRYQFVFVQRDRASELIGEFLAGWPLDTALRIRLDIAVGTGLGLYPRALRSHCSICTRETNWTTEGAVPRFRSDELLYCCVPCGASRLLFRVHRTAFDAYLQGSPSDERHAASLFEFRRVEQEALVRCTAR